MGWDGTDQHGEIEVQDILRWRTEIVWEGQRQWVGNPIRPFTCVPLFARDGTGTFPLLSRAINLLLADVVHCAGSGGGSGGGGGGGSSGGNGNSCRRSQR